MSESTRTLKLVTRIVLNWPAAQQGNQKATAAALAALTQIEELVPDDKEHAVAANDLVTALRMLVEKTLKWDETTKDLMQFDSPYSMGSLPH